MKFKTALLLFSSFWAAFGAVTDAYAVGGRLSPQNFNKMYYLAAKGKVGILREAINRGLNIDAVNPNGDTGLCIAVKRKNYIAYNSFRMSGANPRHACTYRMYKEYQEFLDSQKAAKSDQIIGNEESLYYKDDETNWWPWILGGAALGGGALALSSGGGGKSRPAEVDNTIIPTDPGFGLTAQIVDYHKLVSQNGSTNDLKLDASNPDSAAVVNNIKFLPNMLDNADYLQTYIKVVNGAYFDNMFGGGLYLGDAAVGISAYDKGSRGKNNGVIEINARNGSIGLAASNGSVVFNNPDKNIDGVNGSINMTFTGNNEGDTIIGMYADTGSWAANYGQITGTTSFASQDIGDTQTNEGPDGILADIVGDESAEDVSSANSGTILGMALFDFYTGTNNSTTSVKADNYGSIMLSAGYNSSADVAVNLVGMGSYIDDKFLNGNSNPAFAEKMLLNNYGDISLSYQGKYALADEALKLGDGGLIGMRADASTQAQNTGNIDINLTRAVIDGDALDVAVGMLSVHGAQLTNGLDGFHYDGTTTETGGTIRIMNQARGGGVSYGMLADKGDGTQTRVYDWAKPELYNYGLIDMQVSNAFGMASFAGGEVVNMGVINLGRELGQSYYTNNYGLYAAAGSVSDEVLLRNDGIINVYSEQSMAIYNAFAGSVSLQNNGTIYVSNKATGSQIFGGNFSEAVNNGDIVYIAGNSENFTYPTGNQGDVGFNEMVSPVASVMHASSNEDTTKQYISNNGTLIIGGVLSDADYGGTYGTAGIQVSRQGSAENKHVITLNQYDVDSQQFNVGMWLDSTTTAESYMNNKGTITVNAVNSTGMRNDSQGGAQATNLGTIWINGQYGHGMAVTTTSGKIFNGRANDMGYQIHVNGENSVGMYVGNGVAYNYGTISLEKDNTTAFQLSGADAQLMVSGNIEHQDGLNGVTYFWTNDNASIDLSYKAPITVEGYTLGKATNKGSTSFSKNSTAYVSGANSHLLLAENNGSVYNNGTVYASGATKAIVAQNGGLAYNQKTINVSDNSIGMYGEDTGSVVTTTAGSVITVQEGTGIRAENLAEVENSGNINVQKGVGIYLTDGSNTVFTQGTNNGAITVSGTDNKGVMVINGATFINDKGTVNASSGAYGIYSTASVTNNGQIAVGDNSKGIYAAGGTVNNTGGIAVNSDSGYGIYNTGADVTSSGEIVVNAGTGVYGSLNNTGQIDVYANGIGVDGKINNSGAITAYGMSTGVKGAGENSGTITNNGGGAGVLATGLFTNSGTIDGKNVGVQVDGGNFINTGGVNISSGTGVYVTNGSAMNYGTIAIGTGKGVHVDGASSRATNYGDIVLTNAGYGAYVTNSGTFINSGTITYDGEKGGHCANVGVGGECIDSSAKNNQTAAANSLSLPVVPVFVGEGASFVNKGEMNFGEQIADFDDMREKSGSFVIAKGGTYAADGFKGDVVAGKDIVMGGFADTYMNENSFEGKNYGLGITSESYLFEASLKENEDTVDVELNRKKFEDVVDEKDLANFFETNYQQGRNEKIFNALKSAENKQDFATTVDVESGKNFYADLQRENMAVLRGVNTQEQQRILEDGLQGRFIGADYYRTGKDASDGVSSFADDVYSIYAGYGAKLNQQWSIGGTLRAIYADSDFDEAHSERENKILMAFLPIMYKNGNAKFLTMPQIGVGYGSYNRRAYSDAYEADTFDVYYGLYNHAEYSIDMKVAELVTEAELNLQGSSMSKSKEDDGLYVRANNALSLESGIGVKLRKRIELAKQRSLMLAVGVKYYHEFLDPYKNLTVGMTGSPVNYRVNGYDEDKDRIRTSAEAVYKDGDFAVAAEIAHNAEKESSVEGGLGVRYNF